MARSTTFYLYKNVNLSPATGDTFHFATRTAQTQFFTSKLYTSITSCSYQREGRLFFKVPLPISSCYDIDYCAFVNTQYEGKLYYCFVTGVEYISDNVTCIYYSIDYLQTWLLDAVLKPCFIERCHSASDNIGDNLIEENLDLGEYLMRTSKDNIYTNEDILVIFQATFDIFTWLSSLYNTKTTNTTTMIRNGIVDGLCSCAVYLQWAGQFADSNSALCKMLANLQVDSTGSGVTMEDIVNIYIYPKTALELSGATYVPQSTGADEFKNAYQIVPYYENNQTWTEYGREISLPTIPTDGQGRKTIGSYIPKNNKLFTYPFTLLHVTNNNGSAIDLHYERFADPTAPKALVNGTTAAEAKIRLTPKAYYGGDSQKPCFEYSLDSAPFPTVSIAADSFNIYLAQNRNTIYNGYEQARENYNKDIIMQGLGGISSLLGAQNTYQSQYNKARGSLDLEGMDNAKAGLKSSAIGTGLSTLSGMGNSAYSYYQSQKQMLAELKDKLIAPATAIGVQANGISYQNNKQTFSFYVKTIDEQHARAIDDFYTMYGYPAKYVGVPSMHNRTYFTYVKTSGLIATGSIPLEAKQTIQTLFDNGLRFWAVPSSIGDYSVNNAVLP